jgi:hypothetical protein
MLKTLILSLLLVNISYSACITASLNTRDNTVGTTTDVCLLNTASPPVPAFATLTCSALTSAICTNAVGTSGGYGYSG